MKVIIPQHPSDGEVSAEVIDPEVGLCRFCLQVQQEGFGMLSIEQFQAAVKESDSVRDGFEKARQFLSGDAASEWPEQSVKSALWLFQRGGRQLP